MVPRKHPSGRPIVRREVKSLSLFRGAGRGSEIPRMREDVRDLSLVGFHHHYVEREDDDGDA